MHFLTEILTVVKNSYKHNSSCYTTLRLGNLVSQGAAAPNQSSGPYLLVPCPDFTVEIKCFLGLHEFAAMEEIGADHDSCSALPRLTVDGRHMIVVFTEPLVQVFTKRLDELQLRRVVVFEGILCNWCVERIVWSDLCVTKMFVLKKKKLEIWEFWVYRTKKETYLCS